MSLSEFVLNKNYDGVAQLLAQGAQTDYLDRYGYTPLIQAAITNQSDIVALLLKYNAEVDLLDITGSTALHWAVDNSNYEICELLLKKRASPNVASSNGQPILFYPLLRKDTALIKLLTQYGANLQYGKDYINAKLVGHRFELKGSCDVINPDGLFTPIDLEGFYLEFTLALVRDSLVAFINSYVAHRMDIHINELKKIVIAFSNAIALRAFKHFSQDVEINKPKIIPLLEADLLLLPVSYRSHAITYVKHGDFLAKCDRGVEKMTDPIVIYKVGNKKLLNSDFLVDLLYNAHDYKFIKHDLNHLLNLYPYAKLPIKHQITGNCSWANTESSVPTMLYMLLHDNLKNSHNNNKEKTAALVPEIMRFYTAWLEWDKDRALEDCLEDFDNMSFNRQKARAALLGAVLFQSCSPNKPGDVARAKKILAVLSRKEFNYVVRIYANIFIRSQQNSQGSAYKHLIELCGYKLNQFSG